MGTPQKILIGGIGGIVPVFMNLVVIDWGKVLAASNFDTFVVLGWVVKVTALFSLGGFWVWLHKNEQEPLAVFQLGMLAPMVITALLNGNNVLELTKEQQQSANRRQVEGTAPRISPPATDSPRLFPSTYPFAASAAHAATQAPREITGKDDAPMVLVTAGEFTMGMSESAYSRFVRGLFGKTTGAVPDDETPAHQVYLDAFYMDKYEVTTARYAKFLEATNRKRPGYWHKVDLPIHGDRPVVGVNWYDAEAYCGWTAKRLPTEAEWEKAARGTERRIYPWGNEHPPPKQANYGQGRGNIYSDRLAAVDNYESGTSPYGIYQLAGNVWEWVADWYDKEYYKSSPDRNPKGPSKGFAKGLRGGSWFDPPEYLRSGNRFHSDPSEREPNIGFRCLQDIPK